MSDKEEYRGGISVTKQQAAVVDHVLSNQITVVAAGAGSGKTYTTVATVLELIGQRRASIDQFALITFTNKAADELRIRFEESIKGRYDIVDTEEDRLFWKRQQESLSIAYVGTIHGFCRQVIRTFGYDGSIARDASVSLSQTIRKEAFEDTLEIYLQEEDGLELLGENSNIETYNFIDLMDRVYEDLRNQGFDSETTERWTEEQEEDRGKIYRIAVARLINASSRLYDQRKQEKQIVDSQDLLSKTAAVFSGDQGTYVAKRLKQRYKYLFVDEFQDTDRVQKKIVDVLISTLDGVLVVGDSKQSIYLFRGAEESLLRQMADEQGVPLLPLNLSGRPTRRFLLMQNALFESMKRNFPQLGEPLEERPGILNPEMAPVPFTYIDVDVSQFSDANRMQRRIQVTAEHIRSLLGQPIELGPENETAIDLGHIVILARTNKTCAAYAEGLRNVGIEVGFDSGESFYRRPEIVSTYRIMRLLLHYPDDAILSLALQTPYLNHVDATMTERYILQYGAQRGTPLMDWFEANYPEDYKKLKELRRLMRSETVPQILARLYDAYDIRSKVDTSASIRLERLREKARNLFSEDQALTLRTFVENLQISILTDRQENEVDIDVDDGAKYPTYIRVMTIHQAKGLEFPIVIIPEAHDDLYRDYIEPDFLVLDKWGLEVKLPLNGQNTLSSNYAESLNQIKNRSVEEEMRIFYVAITRAEQAVVAIGSGGDRSNTYGRGYYSWQDEILNARKSLSGLGAQFIRV